MSILLVSLFVCFGAWAKTLDQKKTELKKIYEAGGISKIEYDKAQGFLENSEEKTKEKKLKQTFDLSKKNKSKYTANSILKKYKEKDKITNTMEHEKMAKKIYCLEIDNSLSKWLEICIDASYNIY